MNDMDSGLQKLEFSQAKCEGGVDFPVTRDDTRLVPSRVTSKEEPIPLSHAQGM